MVIKVVEGLGRNVRANGGYFWLRGGIRWGSVFRIHILLVNFSPR